MISASIRTEEAEAEAYRGKLEKELRLSISEAFLRGMRESEFLELCSSIFSGMHSKLHHPQQTGGE